MTAARCPSRLTLKLVPWHGQMIRDEYRSVYAGYHMNKEHWNSIDLDGSVPEEELLSWIDESYTLVFQGLPEKVQQEVTNSLSDE